MFDFNDYPKDSKLFDPVNKKVIRKMKDEVKRKIISEFVGLKSKKYSLVVVDSKKIKKAKEVNENVVNLAFCLIKTWQDIKWKELKVDSACFWWWKIISNDGINNLAYYHIDIIN